VVALRLPVALLGSGTESWLYPVGDPNRTSTTARLSRRYHRKASFETQLGVAFKQAFRKSIGISLAEKYRAVDEIRSLPRVERIASFSGQAPVLGFVDLGHRDKCSTPSSQGLALGSTSSFPIAGSRSRKLVDGKAKLCHDD
jgi:hypothetical protein